MGLRGARLAREGIRSYNKRIEQNKEEMLRKFIEFEPRACHATILQNLLTKQWSEELNAYKILSKITPKKE